MNEEVLEEDDDRFVFRHTTLGDEMRVITLNRGDEWLSSVDIKHATVISYYNNDRKSAVAAHRRCMREAGPWWGHFATYIVRGHRALHGLETIGVDNAANTRDVFITTCGNTFSFRDNRPGGSVTCLTCSGTILRHEDFEER